jgi:hypothetical protein
MRILAAVVLLVCGNVAIAQKSNFYVQKGVFGDIYNVTFAELIVFSQELDGKLITIDGFCEAIPRNGKNLFYFSTREASDGLRMREAIELAYAEPKGKSLEDLPTYEGWKKIVNHHQCSVLGIYSTTSKVPPDGYLPTRGSIGVYLLTGGYGRIENEPADSKGPHGRPKNVTTDHRGSPRER